MAAHSIPQGIVSEVCLSTIYIRTTRFTEVIVPDKWWNSNRSACVTRTGCSRRANFAFTGCKRPNVLSRSYRSMCKTDAVQIRPFDCSYGSLMIRTEGIWRRCMVSNHSTADLTVCDSIGVWKYMRVARSIAKRNSPTGSYVSG